ncbi:hypothetical protein ACJJIQ_09985 [Microbulbifer sp. ANSA003]|uniref:hypothetical protein n=1 Tax=Microbulbifer sp. ANSA003 TaxID=3243360 RepID=UPI004042E401
MVKDGKEFQRWTFFKDRSGKREWCGVIDICLIEKFQWRVESGVLTVIHSEEWSETIYITKLSAKTIYAYSAKESENIKFRISKF